MSINIPLLIVVIRHYQTYADGKGKMGTYWLAFKMLILPLLVSVVICFPLAIYLKNQATNALLTVMAVFVPLLFTALISLHDTRQNLKTRQDNDPSQTTKYEYLLTKYEHLADNVSFILILSVLELILLFTMICVSGNLRKSPSVTIVSLYNTLVFYLLQVILYHLIFVIERLAALIKVTSK